MMIPSVLEKALYVGAVVALYAQHRVPASHLATAAVDSILAVLFVIAFFTSPR